MASRMPLSPLTNSPLTPLRPVRSKIQSPSNSKHLSNFGDVDEGRQKKANKRRSAVHELLVRQKIGSGSSPPSSPGGGRSTSEALNGLTSAQLQNHYSDCIKLSTENKINAKNAFGLHLIDYMTDLVKKKELDNFQVASSTLDASVKIYAGRVDFIHNHMNKILSGLVGNQNNGKDDNDDPDNPNDNMDEAGTAKAKKKKKTRAQTIETNLKNINVDKFELEFEVDPMFQMMSAAFDEGGASGLLLNRLRCYESSQALVLDASNVVNVVEDVEPAKESRVEMDLPALTEMLANVNLDEKKICPSMCDFKFMEWDREASIASRQFSDFVFDPTATPESESLPQSTEESSAIAHIEIDDMDNMEDDPDSLNNSDAVTAGDLRTAEFVDSAFSDLTQGSVGKLRQILAMQPSDYSYFNKVMLQTWAGPSHWRVAHSAHRVPGKGPESKTQPRRHKKPPMVFTCCMKDTDLMKPLKMSKATAVTKATWGKYTKKKTTLPDDLQSDNQDLHFKLFNRPAFMIKMQRANSTSVDDGIENYDYNNKNDAENFCPLVRDDDDDEDCSGGFDLSNEVNFGQASQNNMTQASMFSECDMNGTVITQDKLVAAPHKVQKIDIKYAKAAKRVDVRRLKSTMWQILTQKEQIQSDVPLPVSSSQDELLNDDKALPQNFSSLKDILPSNVSQGMAKNLTIQSVFACLLYLTNEKTLKLSSTVDMADIDIEQDFES